MLADSHEKSTNTAKNLVWRGLDTESTKVVGHAGEKYEQQGWKGDHEKDRSQVWHRRTQDRGGKNHGRPKWLRNKIGQK